MNISKIKSQFSAMKTKLLQLKLSRRIDYFLLAFIVCDLVMFAAPSSAIDQPEIPQISESAAYAEAYSVKWEGNYVITAYNSEAAQCDASPCITANGFNVCQHGIEDTIAANFLKFGTKVRIPEVYGDQIFVVRDRMNKKHSNRVDVWLKDKQSAIQFGAKYTKIEVLE